MMELLQDAHFWVGVAFFVFAGILVAAGVHKLAWTMLGDAGRKVQAQLDEAERLRLEAQSLLDQIKTRREEAEAQAQAMLVSAREDAKRLQADAKVKLEEQIKRRGEMAERKIAQAEAQATAAVKAAAAEMAADAAETVLRAHLKGKRSDPLVDRAVEQMAEKLG